MFGKLAEGLKPYMTKGKQVCVVGHLKQDKWTDAQGQNHSAVSIIADEIELVGGQNQQQGGNYQQNQPQRNYQQQGGYQQQSYPQQSYPQQNGYQSQPQSVAQPMIQQPQQSFADEGFPEDIPF